MLESTDFAPASNPAWNFWMRSMSTPPMNPMWWLCDFIAAAAPTRYAPSFSANSSEDRLPLADWSWQVSQVVWSTKPSTSPNFTSGYFAAAAPTVGAYRNPTPITSWNPVVATRSSSSARFVPPEFGWSSFASMLKSCFALSRPAAAASLKDLSPRPPRSYSNATLTGLPCADGVEPGGVLFLLHAPATRATTQSM